MAAAIDMAVQATERAVKQAKETRKSGEVVMRQALIGTVKARKRRAEASGELPIMDDDEEPGPHRTRTGW